VLWYVNPKKPNLAVNLAVIATIALKQNMIFLDSQTWVFEEECEAKNIYEEIIKLVQEFRYKRSKLTL